MFGLGRRNISRERGCFQLAHHVHRPHSINFRKPILEAQSYGLLKLALSLQSRSKLLTIADEI
jgi:hypothetical protein